MLKMDARAATLEQMSDDRRRKARNHPLSPAAEKIVAAGAEPTISAPVIIGAAQIVEAVTLILVGAVCYFGSATGGHPGYALAILLGGTLLYSLLGSAVQTHQISAYRTRVRQTARSLASFSVVYVVSVAFANIVGASGLLSGGWITLWYFAGSVAIIAMRAIIRALVYHWTMEGRLRSRTVIVGGGKDAETLVKLIAEASESEIYILGLFDDRFDERSPDTVAGCPKLGRVSDLIEFARQTRVDLVLVSMPLSAEKRVVEMYKKLWVLPVDIRLSAHLSQLNFTRRAYSYVGNVAVFDMADCPITGWNLVYKWLFDKLVAVGSLVLLSPVMLVTALAIKLDSRGPVFFRQRRHGFNNEYIDVLKFRSMYTNTLDFTAEKLVTKGDPRVTRVGRFIRKTSIDELPQLFNVLRGELSIIGPRPHVTQAKAANKLYQEAVDGYFARHKVKPGITGWAQINGWRGETDTVEKIMQRVNHDLYYIENWSLLFDLYILIKTPISLITKSENAY